MEKTGVEMHRRASGPLKPLAFLAAAAGLALGLAAGAGAQDVVALAKQEKERRASLKTAKKVVINDKSLAAYKAKLESSGAWVESGEAKGKAQAGAAPANAAVDKTPVPGASPRIIPKVEKPGPRIFTKLTETDSTPGALDASVKQARDKVDLLQTKLKGLWQEYYGLGDRDSKDDVTRRIAAVQADLEAAKAEFDRLAALKEKADSAIQSDNK